MSESNWDDLPILHGEESKAYEAKYYRYGHRACPGTGEEVDVCAAPWDCASKGRCRLLFEWYKDVIIKPSTLDVEEPHGEDDSGAWAR